MKNLPDIQKRSEFINGCKVEDAHTGKYGYYWLTRAKKSHNWTPVAYANSPGDCCHAAAVDYFAKHGYTETNFQLGKLVDTRTWEQFQHTYHLRAVGIK